MELFFRDLRYGMRMLARKPGITVVAIMALALGIGANSAIFSVIYAVLLRPLPVRDADRLVTMATESQKINVTGAQPGFTVYAAWKEHGQFLESIAAAATGTAPVSASGPEETARLWRVTASFLPTLGVEPRIGRNFSGEEDQPGGARVALIADSFWRSKFNRDPRVLGATIRIEGQPCTVIGVLPPGFHVDGRPADVYVPLARSLNAREWLPVNIYARLKPGVSVQQAQAQVDARAKGIDPGPLGWKTRVYSLREFLVRDFRLSLWVLLGAVGLVLLIACSNTASLLLARASARQKEMAVRISMGAQGRQLVRQLLTESALLALAGGLCGLLLARLSVQLVPLLWYQRLPGLLQQTRVDGTVLVFTLAVSLLTGFVFGTAPALRATRVNVGETLKEAGRGVAGASHTRGWKMLIVTETAIAVVLAIGASLLIRTFFYLRDVAPGFSVENLVTARITPPRGKFTAPAQAIAYWKDVVEGVRKIPGVRGATFAQALPLTGDVWVMSWPVEGHPFSPPNDVPTMWQRIIETDYFRSLQIPLRNGRLFNEGDNAAGPKVVVVNEAFVRRFWPGQQAIGKHLGGSFNVPMYEVVGVVGDVRAQDTTRAAIPELYIHYLQMPPGRVALAIRTDPGVYRNPLVVEPEVRRAVAAIDPTQPVTQFAEMQRLISDRVAANRLSAQLIAMFAGLALVLAAVGIYGVLSFSVAQRTHEIGVRMALGAGRDQVLRMILKEAGILAAAGIGIGIVGALVLTRVMRSLLFGVSATAPVAYTASCLVLMVVALLAAAVPAYRAARVDPLVALRDAQ